MFGNTITITGHGFANGMAVTYEAPAGLTFLSPQVDVVVGTNDDGTIVLTNAPGAENIRFADDDGKPLDHSYVDGERVVYTVQSESGGPGTPIGGLEVDRVYRVVVVNDSTIQLKRNDAVVTDVRFVRSATGDQLIRADGLSWEEAGFKAGDPITVGSSDPTNNGSFTIQSLSGATMTLTAANTVTATRVIGDMTFSSSGGEEPVSDAGKDGHSVFAWHLIRTLERVGQWSNGVDVYERLAEAVQLDFPQQPQYGAALGSGHEPGADFLFEVRRY